jgi:hypothetical protein
MVCHARTTRAIIQAQPGTAGAVPAEAFGEGGSSLAILYIGYDIAAR